MVLSKANILGAQDFTISRILVDAWGGEVCLRPFSARLKDKIEQMSQSSAKDIQRRAISLAGSICDENGKLIFVEKDIEALADKDGNAVDLVMVRILEINGLTEAELDESVKN